MAISRAQLLKELLPGLNALFGMEYSRYGEEHKEIFVTETSERSFEEEVKLSGFSAAPVKNEGSAIAYDNAQEAFSARYSHETIALGFSITEEAIEDNLEENVGKRNRYYESMADQQMRSVDNNFMRENDARMPLFSEKRAEVTFGRGK